MAAHLELKVGPAEELELAARMLEGQVASEIVPLAVQDHEALGLLLRPVQVPDGQALARDHHLAGLADWNSGAVRAAQPHPGARYRHADRHSSRDVPAPLTVCAVTTCDSDTP